MTTTPWAVRRTAASQPVLQRLSRPSSTSRRLATPRAGMPCCRGTHHAGRPPRRQRRHHLPMNTGPCCLTHNPRLMKRYWGWTPNCDGLYKFSQCDTHYYGYSVYGVCIGVNITAFGRDIPLFDSHPAFQLQCYAFLRISVLSICMFCLVWIIKQCLHEHQISTARLWISRVNPNPPN